MDTSQVRRKNTLFRRLTDDTDEKNVAALGKSTGQTDASGIGADNLAFAFIDGGENRIKYNMFLNQTDLEGIKHMLECEHPELFHEGDLDGIEKPPCCDDDDMTDHEKANKIQRQAKKRNTNRMMSFKKGVTLGPSAYGGMPSHGESISKSGMAGGDNSSSRFGPSKVKEEVVSNSSDKEFSDKFDIVARNEGDTDEIVPEPNSDGEGLINGANGNSLAESEIEVHDLPNKNQHVKDEPKAKNYGQQSTNSDHENSEEGDRLIDGNESDIKTDTEGTLGDEDGSSYAKKMGILKILNSKSMENSKIRRDQDQDNQDEFFTAGAGKFKNILKAVRADKIPEKKVDISEASGSSSIKNVMSMDSFNILSKLIQNNKTTLAPNTYWLFSYFTNMIVLIVGLLFSNFLMNTFEAMNDTSNAIYDKSCNYTTYQTGFYYYLHDFYALKTNVTTWAALAAVLPGFDLLDTYKTKSMDWYNIGVNATDVLLHTIFHSSIIDNDIIKMMFEDKIKIEFFEYAGNSILTQEKKEMHQDLSNNFILSEGYDIIEKTSLPLASFNNYNLNPTFSFVSANISGNLGGALTALLAKIREITNSNLSDSVLKTFLIQLVCQSSLNVICIIGMILFLWKINQTLKWCYEGFAFMKASEIEIQNGLSQHVLTLMGRYKYNEKLLVNEFIDQKFSNKKIVQSVEQKYRAMNKTRNYAEIVQQKLFPNHHKIILRLLWTILMFIAYLAVIIIIMFNMQSTAKIAVFEIDSCQSRSAVDLIFRELYYEFSQDSTSIYTIPTEESYNKMQADAQDYPKFFTDKTNDLGFYFGGEKNNFENILNGDFCTNHVTRDVTISEKLSKYVCENFSGQTAREGLLSFWYYEIETMRSIYLDIKGKKNTLSPSAYTAYKGATWNSKTYIELRFSHYELNDLFYNLMTVMLQKNKQNYVDSVKLMGTLQLALFLTQCIPASLWILYFTYLDLQHDATIAVETFRILDTRLVCANPYLKNRLKFFFNLSGLAK